MVRPILLALPLIALIPTGYARACDLALLLAVDVSGSVDPEEYATQRDGLAEALRDPVIAEALIRAEAQLALVQWTGRSRQRMTVPWMQVTDQASLDRLTGAVAADPRVWRNFSTAIGEALAMAHAQFAAVPDCGRRVIDISGDGRSNEGISPVAAHPRLRDAGITVNALVIEGSERNLTEYFRAEVIRGPGAFAVTANGFREYPAKIRLKLLREVTEPISLAD